MAVPYLRKRDRNKVCLLNSLVTMLYFDLVLDSTVAAQNLEYKMSNILDKPHSDLSCSLLVISFFILTNALIPRPSFSPLAIGPNVLIPSSTTR